METRNGPPRGNYGRTIATRTRWAPGARPAVRRLEEPQAPGRLDEPVQLVRCQRPAEVGFVGGANLCDDPPAFELLEQEVRLRPEVIETAGSAVLDDPFVGGWDDMACSLPLFGSRTGPPRGGRSWLPSGLAAKRLPIPPRGGGFFPRRPSACGQRHVLVSPTAGVRRPRGRRGDVIPSRRSGARSRVAIGPGQRHYPSMPRLWRRSYTPSSDCSGGAGRFGHSDRRRKSR